MLCYDRTKCGVVGPQLARLTQRYLGYASTGSGGGYGGTGTSSSGGGFVIPGVGSVSLPQQRAQFDSTRQNVWRQFADMVDAVDRLKRTGQLTREQLQGYMRSLQTLIENFRAYYDRIRALVTPGYGDSRFHDFYDVFLAKYDEWQDESLSMPSSGMFGAGGFSSVLSGMDGSAMLMLAGLAFMVFSGRRSRA